MKAKIKITAIDQIGREEFIRLVVSEKTAEILANAEYTFAELAELLYRDNLCRFYSKDDFYFTAYQARKINNFLELIYHKFYNYTMEINIE